MSRIAYRLCTIKDETRYIKAGYTEEEAKAIINAGYDIDADFTTKADYIKEAKEEAERIAKAIGKPIDWRLLFGEPKDINYRFCKKCGWFFWAGEPCGCEED